MALQNNTSIYINGKEITAFKKLMLHQQIDAHHILQIICRMDVLEDLNASLGEASRNFLGEIITVQTTAVDANETYKDLEFKGVVTQVKTVKGYEHSSGDEIIIKAQSPTFITDDGPHYASHNDVTLSDILQKTFQDYDRGKLETMIQPNNNLSPHYSVQHNESAFAYASRLAAQYGEWFYYNGEKLVFGKPDTTEVELTYGFDLKEYHLDLMPKSHNYKYFANDYLTDEMLEKDSKEVRSNTSGYNGFVSNKASDLYTKETKVWANQYNDPQAKQRLDNSIELQKQAIEIRQVQLTAVSDNPGVKLGSIVIVDYSKYRVINITHTNNENGDYQNHFKAVTAEVDAYPNTNIHAFPKSETQTAIVMDNTDPDGIGRIRVQFPWQTSMGEMTPWIRIVSPHAGADKGFHFIPEINEEVLIGFEGGNAEHPYVLGSLYNGNAAAGEFKSDANDIKSIRTRSGHTIELNDTKGEEKINIYDNEGSIITFDTQAKSLYISATENIEFTAKNIKMIAEENIDFQAKGDVISASEGDTSILAKGKTALQSTGAIDVSSDASISIEAKTDAELKGQTVAVEGKTEAKLKGIQTSVEGKMTAIQGAAGKLDVM